MPPSLTTEAKTLKPCPFCGTTEGLYPSYRWPGTGKPYAVDCVGCGIDFVPREGLDVIAAWNRRTVDPSLLSLIEDMAKALEAAKKRMRNCRGAIESNQVVDKDTRGSLTNGMADLDAALSRYTEFMEQNNA